jgi:hypothetical protein
MLGMPGMMDLIRNIMETERGFYTEVFHRALLLIRGRRGNGRVNIMDLAQIFTVT